MSEDLETPTRDNTLSSKRHAHSHYRRHFIIPTSHALNHRQSRVPGRRPGFKAVAYDKTRLSIEPSHVPADDQELLLTEARDARFPDARFPVSFNLYSWSFLHGRYYIGQHRTKPIYCMSVSWPRITLYSGLGTNAPPIGTFVHRRRFLKKKRPRDQVFLPSGTVDIEDKCRFTIAVPAPGSESGATRMEAFEWRRTTGPAVKLLGKHFGLKLVRLETDVGAAGGPIASGGGESVAGLALRGLFRRKAATFRFQGSGAQGVLGQDWEAAAVMTAIGIWDKCERG